MTWNYYLEGYSGGMRVTHYIEGKKTRKAAEKARKELQERFKIAAVGQCLYTFSGENKYARKSYAIVERFNCKPFFEFWPNN